MVIRSNGDCTREVYLTEDKDKETNFLSGEGLWFNFRAQTYVVEYMYVHCYSLYSLCYVLTLIFAKFIVIHRQRMKVQVSTLMSTQQNIVLKTETLSFSYGRVIETCEVQLGL